MRRPAWNDGPVATTNTPVHHYLNKGDVVTSCIIATDRRGPTAYRACDKYGQVWRIVHGGQVPETCLRHL
ncbi:hypothetical protein [Streptomyces sp. NPDC127105]|uniref:hypothetical protein n=1 Tax=Streptomyces sp. NPDC127105 TaxID=3345359 RepID=UPI00364F3E5F